MLAGRAESKLKHYQNSEDRQTGHDEQTRTHDKGLCFAPAGGHLDQPAEGLLGAAGGDLDPIIMSLGAPKKVQNPHKLGACRDTFAPLGTQPADCSHRAQLWGP